MESMGDKAASSEWILKWHSERKKEMISVHTPVVERDVRSHPSEA